MKVLFIGGTGNISTSVSRLAIAKGIDLYHLNRGTRKVTIPGVKTIIADINNAAAVEKELSGHHWDAVVNWIAFSPDDVRRDIALFQGKTAQYVFISSASVYQRPVVNPIITESTPLANPFWQYSRNKITCEEILTAQFRENNFPMTIVRPSLTFDTVIPVPFGGWTEYTIVDRIKKGKKIIVHGDGSSLWTITHATDFAKGFLPLLGHPQALGEAFHITSDELLNWDQIHTALAYAVNEEPRIVHIPSDLLAHYEPEKLGSLIGDKASSVIFDNSKIKRLVPDFKAVVTFAEGIKQTIAWFEADPARMIINQADNDKIDSMIRRYERAFE